jgi:hypothetical protein
VTVAFAGLSAMVDLTALPSSDGFAWRGDPAVLRRQTEEYARDRDAAIAPATAIIDAWRIEARQAGFTVSTVGTRSAGRGDPLHHVVGGSFDPAIEPTAKRLVAELAARLGVPIAEVRNLENVRIWEDLSLAR